MIGRTAFITGCLLSLAAPGVYAQSDPQLRMDTGFYMGLAVGRSESRDVCTTIGGACDAKDVTYGVFGGYQFNRNFGVELGFHDFGEAKTDGFNAAGAAGSFTSETKVLELVGTAGVPLTDNFSLYVKGGIFRFDTDAFLTGFGQASDKGYKGTFGFGAQYKLGRNFAARAEWQRYLKVTNGILGVDGDIGVWRASGLYKF